LAEWYHGDTVEIMSMTLRLTDEADAALERLAKAEGVSKNEAALRAILARDASDVRRDEIRRMTDDIVERYGPLLDRLAQ
jgi:predicted transcriptional regulator